MIYTLCVLVLLAAIVFFHVVEGFFSATLSAIFAVIAAAVAVGYHEQIVESLLGGRFGSESHALVLMMLFALTYLFLRLVFDPLIKGNVRVPALVDKIGGGVMGLVVGIFALGVLTIAAEELPFAPDIAGYARYSVLDSRTATVHLGTYRQDQDRTIDDELASDEVGRFDPADKKHVFPAVDDAVVGTVAWLSNGSMAGTQPLTDIHPDLLQELFGQRLGMETSASHTALDLPSAGQNQVRVLGVYSVESKNLKNVYDQYDQRMRRQPLKAVGTLANLDTLAPDKMLLVVRTAFTKDAADTDGIVRFSPGSIRLDAPQMGDLGSAPGDYYPIGTLEDNTLYVDKPDDFMFVNVQQADRGVDLVFEVDRSAFGKSGATTAPASIMPAGSFLEVKRLARIDLANKPIETVPPTDKTPVGVIHVATGASVAVPTPSPGQHPGTPPAQGPPGTQGPEPTHLHSPPSLVPEAGGGGVLEVQDVTLSAALPARLGTSTAQSKQRTTDLSGGTAILRDGKARDITLDQSPLASAASKGDVGITALLPPTGKVLLKITAKPGTDNSWAWVTHVGKLVVIDAGGTEYPAIGVWATVSVGGADHLLAYYSSQYPLADISPGQGSVTSLVFYVAVPTGTALKNLTLDGKQIKDLAGMSVSP